MWSRSRLLLSSNVSFRHSSLRSLSETILSFKNVSFDHSPTWPLLRNVSFNVSEGSKVTLMGQNGCGKSTLLKLINGSLKPQQGAINIKKGFAVSTALQVITPEDRNRTVLEFFTHYLHGTTSGIESRIAAALQKVKLHAPHDRLVGSFSGGQQARLLLASALIVEPDILLLDEPTNNLDVTGIEVLKEIIQQSDKTCLVISHDEDFLNSFTDSVLYLDSLAKVVETYAGNYLYVKEEITKRIAKENAENARLAREAQRKKEQASSFANKGGDMRKMAKKLRESAEILESNKITVRKEDKALKPFIIPFQGTSGNERNPVGTKLMVINSISFPEHIGQGKTIDFELTPIRLEQGNCLRIKGPNGIGKTTLLESIVKNKAPGVKINPRARIGYYRQDFHNLDFDQTAINALRQASDNKHSEQHIRSIAAQFFLIKDIVNQPIRTLSEGQKGLLSFACLTLQEPAILVVDEPTNHINFRHLPVLAESLDKFGGALLIVSHDEDFVSNLKVDHVIDLGSS